MITLLILLKAFIISATIVTTLHILLTIFPVQDPAECPTYRQK